MLRSMQAEPAQPPPFVGGSELLARAFAYARDAHHGPSNRGETEISHPVAVAEILADAGCDEEIVAAALLHDVIEDTTHDGADIAASFPDRVRTLVEVMSEDESIADYGERKAEHRSRVLAAGEIPASIYLADKLARVRRYVADGEPVDPQRLQHYRDTLEQFSAADPELPFLSELGEDLPQLRAAA